jgi:hypothetical protein
LRLKGFALFHGREGAGKISFWKVGYLALWKHFKECAISADVDQNELLNPTFQERVWKGCGKHMAKMTYPIYSGKNNRMLFACHLFSQEDHTI